jgi:hypothetical protein
MCCQAISFPKGKGNLNLSNRAVWKNKFIKYCLIDLDSLALQQLLKALFMSELNTHQQDTRTRILTFMVEDKPFTTDQQYLTGAQIKKIAGLPKEAELFMTISAPWKDDPIADNEEVDLARPGIEGFYIKKKLKFIIEGKDYETDRQYITGAEIRRLGNIPAGYQIFLSIKGPYEDELIEDTTRVNLARPGIENFYGCKPNTTNG